MIDLLGKSRRTCAWGRLLISIFVFATIGCQQGSDDRSSGASTESAQFVAQNEPSEPASHEQVELAVVMGELQRHSMKLGYALAGKNGELASFYLEELEELQEGLMAIGEHDGMPIGAPTRVILRPTLDSLEASLAEVDWQASWQAYEVVIQACNRCHQATEHGYIEILPASGDAPFNQRFKASDGS